MSAARIVWHVHNILACWVCRLAERSLGGSR